MLKLRLWGLATSGARATKCSKLQRWGFILASFVASPMLDNCSPGREKHHKLRWYSGPASHPAPCWARSRTTKNTENTQYAPGLQVCANYDCFGGRGDGQRRAGYGPERQQPCKKVLCLPGLYPFESICYQENKAIRNPMTK